MTDERLIRLRYNGVCVRCAQVLNAGERGWWDGETKTVWCEGCGPAAPSNPAATPTFDASVGPNVAGASAQDEYQRRSQRRDDDVRHRHPHLGNFILAVTNEPQSTAAWARGAVGEERVGRRLDRLVEIGAVVLHDRRIPGSRANIDHVVVAPSGVWVVDAKNHRGKIEVRRRRGFYGRDDRLFVEGRNRTKVVVGMTKQLEAVTFAVADANVPVYTVLCFTGAEWGLFAKPFVIDRVLVTWPKALINTIVQPKGHDIAVRRVAERLATRLPAARRPPTVDRRPGGPTP